MARRVYLGAGLFRVSLPGFDAATATEQQLAFWEGQSSLQPLASGQVTISTTGNITIPFDGTLPLFLVWSVTPGVIVIAERRSSTTLRISLETVRGVVVSSATVFYVVYKNGVALDA